MRKTQENEIKATLKKLVSGDIEDEFAFEQVKRVIEIIEDDLLERAGNLVDTARDNLDNLVQRSYGGGSHFGGCTERVAPA